MSRLLHHGVREQIEAANTSSSRTAEELRRRGIRAREAAIVWGPMVTFLRWLIHRGRVFRGISGTVQSTLEAYADFLTRLKLWELLNVDQDGGRR